MNKVVAIVLIVIGLLLTAYNVTLLDFDNPFKGNSLIAIIGILAALCAIVLILIFITAKKIEKKVGKK